MRCAVLLVVAACGASSRPAPEEPVAQKGVPPVLTHHARTSCAHAAHGLEGATRGVREPEANVFDALVAQCRDGWQLVALDCFAKMREGELGRCARILDARQREALFATLAGSEPNRAGLAVARARLEQLSVGIEPCDRFVSAVNALLACDGLSLEMRLQLGNETAQFWSLPTDRLAPDDRERMSQVCVSSLETLTRETAPVGCAP